MSDPQERRAPANQSRHSSPLMSDIASEWSPAHDAGYNGRLLSLRDVIDQGTSVNLTTLDNVSPLHGTCLQGHAACAKLLLERGADVNLPTIDWKTPLSLACEGGSVACVNLLLQFGASLQSTCTSTSPIHQAAAKGHTECIESLLKYGADIDQWTDDAGTPLNVACAHQQLGTVEKLLQLGADVNKGKDGNSSLHTAAELSNLELVNTLLEHGADHTARNKEGRRPQEMAPPNSAVEKLLKRGGGVSSLMQLCRLFIRRILGRRRLKEIHGLPLPTDLQRYLILYLHNV
ncbi:ankyrin repeat and SOCS box protein 9-like isoform X2 [Denticeps clupeoides]|uniref:SOCS box domain-containing protein n=1 Tax=Denticeps clupeoides TaxID=299321 RepID=A0AAY4DSF3_9TELE|nr:ankyrin repeat and SOCS box protein 9-like isoform X2 [Denticeps clupeoides]